MNSGCRHLGSSVLIAVAWLLVSATAWAAPASTDPAVILREVDYVQNIGGSVPLSAPLVDESGKAVTLGDYFDGKAGPTTAGAGQRPVVLVLAYYGCPMLCTMVLNGLVDSLRLVPFDAGEKYQVVIISIDPRETPALAAEKKHSYVTHYNRHGAEAGWHFLTGPESSIHQIAQSVGFKYVYDAKTDQFAHPAGIVVLTPGGTIARYFFGTRFDPGDLRFGMLEASSGRMGTAVDAVLLRCYRYDPSTGKYGLVIMGTLRFTGLLTLLLLGGFITWALRRERQLARDIRAAA